MQVAKLQEDSQLRLSQSNLYGAATQLEAQHFDCMPQAFNSVSRTFVLTFCYPCERNESGGWLIEPTPCCFDWNQYIDEEEWPGVATIDQLFNTTAWVVSAVVGGRWGVRDSTICESRFREPQPLRQSLQNVRRIP